MASVVNEDLAAYLESINSRLLAYLDPEKDLSTETVAHLYRYSVALLQALILPEHIVEDWDDYFDLADAFVLAYGSKRLDLLNRRAPVLGTGGEQAPDPLTGDDRLFLVNLVQELGAFLTSRETSTDGGAAQR